MLTLIGDYQDALGKVAKLLGNDLVKADEEFAEHLQTFRTYFKSLRTREEKFSTMKKNKDSLQNKIDNADKKISKMNPEHKDLPGLKIKLAELMNEMEGMDRTVVNEDAALADFRRQTARTAVSHKVRLSTSNERATLLMYLLNFSLAHYVN